MPIPMGGIGAKRRKRLTVFGFMHKKPSVQTIGKALAYGVACGCGDASM
jgi:hypothetical protein